MRCGVKSSKAESIHRPQKSAPQAPSETTDRTLHTICQSHVSIATVWTTTNQCDQGTRSLENTKVKDNSWQTTNSDMNQNDGYASGTSYIKQRRQG
jgi:hypothetical protein